MKRGSGVGGGWAGGGGTDMVENFLMAVGPGAKREGLIPRWHLEWKMYWIYHKETGGRNSSS